MDWDNLPENLEAWYLRGLNVKADETSKGLNHAFLYGSGAISIWVLMPRMVFFGWVHYAIWAASLIFAYWSLRGIAIVRASELWVKGGNQP